jgi:hypothetical protein
MTKRISLPGSTGDEAGAPRAERSGGFSELERDALSELARWWRHRRAREDSADPLETAFGGVDDSATVRTTGLLPANAFFPKPLVVENGASLLVHAFGVPEDPPAAAEVYSIFGLCHLYRDGTMGWLGRSTTIARAPATATTLEVRVVVTGPPPGTTPVIQITGIHGLTIDWKVEVYRLER